jgi:hypothetical protein
MTDLIKRLEEAEAGSRDLDALICVTTNDRPPWARRAPEQLVVNGSCVTLGKDGAGWPSESYTTSLDSALALAERVLPGWGWEISHDDCIGNYYAWVGKDFYLRGPQEHLRGIQETPALALCIAVLKATDTGREG